MFRSIFIERILRMCEVIEYRYVRKSAINDVKCLQLDFIKYYNKAFLQSGMRGVISLTCIFSRLKVVKIQAHALE